MFKKRAFPCFACGKCCQKVGEREQAIFLDRGDGVCRHFDDATHTCKIYASRPLICRVEDYFDTYASHIYSWEEFIEINLSVCHKLNE